MCLKRRISGAYASPAPRGGSGRRPRFRPRPWCGAMAIMPTTLELLVAATLYFNVFCLGLALAFAVEQHGLDFLVVHNSYSLSTSSSFLFKHISPHKPHLSLKDLGNKPEQSHISVKNLWAQTRKSAPALPSAQQPHRLPQRPAVAARK